MRILKAALAATALVLLTGATASAQIVNGSFELDYVGWTFAPPDGCATTWGIGTDGTTLNTGEPAHDFQDNIDCPQTSPGLPIDFTATDGEKLSFLLGNQPSASRMYQDFVVGAPSALHWDMQYLNHQGVFDGGRQFLAIRLRNPANNAILTTLFISSGPQNSPMAHYSADLSAYTSIPIRLSVERAQFNHYFDVQFDNFQVVPHCAGPVLSSVTASPSMIWAPNHKLVPVTVTVDAVPQEGCDPPSCRIVSVASNETANGRGDGNTSTDASITGDLTAMVRAERSGGGDGRTYTLTVECTDNSGIVVPGTAIVSVPHDRRK